jgi:hypothetical protein
MAISRLASVVALLAISVWLGGLVALGALAAPVIFSMVPLGNAADAMTVVFRRFDSVAMACAVVVLLSEAARMAAGPHVSRVDVARGVISALAAIAAVLEGIQVSPRIAELHSEGVSRGLGARGMDLANLHKLAELFGQAELVLLGAVIVLHVVTLSDGAGRNFRNHQGAAGHKAG